MSNPHRPSKTDRTRIRRAIRKAITDKKNTTQATRRSMTYVGVRTGAAK